jgi:hypothetical protein
MEKEDNKPLVLLGGALLSGGLIAASPVDEMACVATGPLAPVCIAIAASVSTPLGLAAAATGVYILYKATKD